MKKYPFPASGKIASLAGGVMLDTNEALRLRAER